MSCRLRPRAAAPVIICMASNLQLQLRQRLAAGQYAEIAGLAQQHKRILSLLTGLSYDLDPHLAENAIQAFGLAAGCLAEHEPEYVRNHLRRLFWLVNDESGGIGWRAPELIGEALFRCPGQFDEFLSPLVHLLDMEAEDAPRFRLGVLHAMLRLLPICPQLLQMARPLVQPLCDDPDPAVSHLAGQIIK